MTTIISRKELKVNGKLFWWEKYQDKEMAMPMYRYGCDDQVIKDTLWSRPNIKAIEERNSF